MLHKQQITSMDINNMGRKASRHTVTSLASEMAAVAAVSFMKCCSFKENSMAKDMMKDRSSTAFTITFEKLNCERYEQFYISSRNTCG